MDIELFIQMQYRKSFLLLTTQKRFKVQYGSFFEKKDPIIFLSKNDPIIVRSQNKSYCTPKVFYGQRFGLSSVAVQRLHHCQKYDQQHSSTGMIQFNFRKVEWADITASTESALISKKEKLTSSRLLFQQVSALCVHYLRKKRTSANLLNQTHNEILVQCGSCLTKIDPHWFFPVYGREQILTHFVFLFMT